MEKEKYQILIVEDDDADVFLLKKALTNDFLDKDLYIVHDGVEAFDFLYHHDRFKSSPKPDLILLDINMPRMNGKEFLKKFKNHSELSTIPVVVLSSTHSESEMREVYQLGANCFINKLPDISEFKSVLNHVENFFLA